MSGAGGEPPTTAPANCGVGVRPLSTILDDIVSVSVQSLCDNEKTLTRSEKRKLSKKQKRQKQRVAEAEIRKQEEERSPPDPEAASQELKERQEAQERARKEHEEQEARWFAREREYEEEAKRRTEQELRDKLLQAQRVVVGLHGQRVVNASEDGGGEESEEEDRPSEIIWQGNEIIVRKKKKAGRSTPLPPLPQPQSPAPYSNPFPPAHLVLGDASLPTTTSLVTEKDRAVCPVFSKTGACAYGGVCSRLHVYPTRSPTLLLPNMFRMPTPLKLPGDTSEEALMYDEEDAAEQMRDFYEDVHTEFQKFGEIRNFKICGNAAPHLCGNVYVHFWKEEAAEAALVAMAGRFYASRPLLCHFSPVTQWRRAICGEFVRSGRRGGYDGATCHRGTGCSFLHPLQNPEGDYEWADADERPPASWTQAMDALYGRKDTSRVEGHRDRRRSSRERRGSRWRSREVRGVSRSPRERRRGGRVDEEEERDDCRRSKRHVRGRSSGDRSQGREARKYEQSNEKDHKDRRLGREEHTDEDRESEGRRQTHRREASRHRSRETHGQQTHKRMKMVENGYSRGGNDGHAKSLEGRHSSIDALDRWQE